MKKVTFINTMPGLLETWPIEPMSKAIPSWVRVARDDYVKNKDVKSTHIFRCSGIGDLYKTGFVVRSWHDTEVYADPNSTNIEFNKPGGIHERAVDIQPGDGIAKFLPKRPWSNKTIMKFHTPWHVISDVKLLMIPIPYTNNFDFESCPGILDSSISSELNIQLYWNRQGETHIVDAGTPLCQLIPLCDEPVEFEMRDATPKDRLWLEKKHYVNRMSFAYSIKKGKNLFKQFWNKS